MNNKRKPRSTAARVPRTRGERSVTADGVYQNAHFMHAITSHVGNNVRVCTMNGSIFEGIFKTFSSTFEVVVEMAHKVDVTNPNKINVDTVVEKLIFKPEDIVSVEAKDVDLEFATRDTFQTDTAISKFNGIIGEKELEPWDGSGCNGDELELEPSGGWDVNEMFQKNEQVYGVTTSFQPSMESYTVPLQKKDTKEFKEAEAKAARIANEIENNPTYKLRAELENGDEEETFAAVHRPSQIDGQGVTEGKYVPPAKRKTPQSGKNSSPPVQQQQAISPPPVSSQPQVQTQHSTPTPKSYTSGNNFHHNTLSFPNIVTVPQTATVNQPPPAPMVHALPIPSNSYQSQHTALSQREPKVNGMEPKSQRLTPARPGSRQYTSESSRYQQEQKHGHHGSSPLVLPPAPFPTSVAQVAGSTASQAASPEVQNPKTSEPPPIIPTVPRKVNVPRGTKYGRDDHVEQLKKFGQEFKLAEVEQIVEKKQSIVCVQSQQQIQQPVQVSSQPNIPVQQSTPPLQQPQHVDDLPKEDAVDKVNNTLKKSTLNPNAKEFVYNPKPFTPRAASTPTPSRPHTPQTPQYPPNMTAMVVPTYVMAASQPAFNPQTQGSRFRKAIHMAMPHRPDIASQMQVAAATGQPLLAPAPTPMHAQFTVPYSPQGHIPPQPYQQMMRVVSQQGGMVPIGAVPTSMSYHHDSPGPQPPPGPQIQYMSPAPLPHPHHTHHHHHHAAPPAPSQGPNAPSPAQPPNTPGPSAPHPHPHPQSPAGTYQQPPPPPQGQPPFPMMCQILPAQQLPPPHTPHMMQQPTVQYIHHQPQVAGGQPHPFPVILPHNQ